MNQHQIIGADSNQSEQLNEKRSYNIRGKWLKTIWCIW